MTFHEQANEFDKTRFKMNIIVVNNSKDISDLAKVIIPLFLNDGLSGSNLQIKGDDVNLRNNPWEKNNSNTQVLENGKITIFADKNVIIIAATILIKATPSILIPARII